MSMPQILVADASAVGRMVVSLALTAEPCRVHIALDGRRALELARSQPFDLILLDAQLPVVDALDVCRRLRGTRATWATPILLVSALGAERMEAAFEAGCDGYLTKPIDRGDLLFKVRRLLERRGERRRGAA